MFKKIAALLAPEGVAAENAAKRPPVGKVAVYLTDSEVNTLRGLLSHTATFLQTSRKQTQGLSQLLYNMSDKDQAEDPVVQLSFKALNRTKDVVRKNRALEKKINSIIRAIRTRTL